jgi:hypothetical protein
MRHAPHGTIQTLQRINNDSIEQHVPTKEREDSEMEKNITQNTYTLWTLLRKAQGVLYETLIYGRNLCESCVYYRHRLA